MFFLLISFFWNALNGCGVLNSMLVRVLHIRSRLGRITCVMLILNPTTTTHRNPTHVLIREMATRFITIAGKLYYYYCFV
jgi:hypothetical protein